MAQHPGQFCTECGAPLQAGQRFCSNCGTVMNGGSGAPTVAASRPPSGASAGDPTIAAAPGQPTRLAGENAGMAGSARPAPSTSGASDTPPPPPPTYNPYAGSAPGTPQTYPQSAGVPGYASAPGGAAFVPVPVPAYAQKPKSGHGCLITSIVLLVILAIGIGGFILLNKSHSNANTGSTQQPGSTATASSTGTTPPASVNSSVQLNLKITYASVSLTFTSAQLAHSFPDDSSTTPGAAGIVRVNFQENNTTAGNPDYLLSESMLLVLPGGDTIQRGNSKYDVSPDAGVNRTNWCDFPIDAHVTLNQLVLRLGQASESQMDIPLQAGANIGKYQDKSSSPNAQFQYSGVNWTLKTATLSYSYQDHQASTGNLYVILTFAAVNNGSSDFVNGVSSYMRLQANGSSTEPSGNTTIPIEIKPGTTASGIVAFLMPQGASSFTLVMLGQPNVSPPIAQVSQNFQIQ